MFSTYDILMKNNTLSGDIYVSCRHNLIELWLGFHYS